MEHTSDHTKSDMNIIILHSFRYNNSFAGFPGSQFYRNKVIQLPNVKYVLKIHLSI